MRLNRSNMIGISMLIIFVLSIREINAMTMRKGIDPQKTYYLFAYFAEKEPYSGKGFHPGDGMYLAWSADGLKWNELNGGRVIYKPKNSGGLRDPNIMRGPDGKYRMVWTGGGGSRHGIGYAMSDDLAVWSEDRVIPVMAAEPEAVNVWAPELFYNDIDGRYIIHWASTIPGRFPKTEPYGDRSGNVTLNHRIYYTTTEDFEKFSPVKLLIEPGFNCIDATIVKYDEEKYIMFLKNETLMPPKKHIVIAKSEHPEGPYGKTSKPISPPGAWSEGPTAVVIGGRWHVYFDMYSSGRYGLAVSDDLKIWEDKSGELEMLPGARHGTVFPVSGVVLNNLLDEYQK